MITSGGLCAIPSGYYGRPIADIEAPGASCEPTATLGVGLSRGDPIGVGLLD